MLAHHYVSALELLRAAGPGHERDRGAARFALREAGHRAYSLLRARRSRALVPGRARALAPATTRSARASCSTSAARSTRVAERARGAPRGGVPRLLGSGRRRGAPRRRSALGDVAWMTGNQAESRLHYDRAVDSSRADPPSPIRPRGFGPYASASSRSPVTVRRWRRASGSSPRRKLSGPKLLPLRVDQPGLARNREGDLRGMDELARRARARADRQLAPCRARLRQPRVDVRDARRSSRGRVPPRRGRRGSAVRQRPRALARLRMRARTTTPPAAGSRPWRRRASCSRNRPARSTWTSPCARGRAHPAAARGDHGIALEDADRMLTVAREIGDPQARAVPRASTRGCRSKAACDRPQRRWSTSSYPGLSARRRRSRWICRCLTVSSLPRRSVAAPRPPLRWPKAVVRTPWAEAASSSGTADHSARCATSSPSATRSPRPHMCACSRPRVRGHERLADAIAFFERVGATAYLARAEALLQATA